MVAPQAICDTCQEIKAAQDKSLKRSDLERLAEAPPESKSSAPHASTPQARMTHLTHDRPSARLPTCTAQ